MTAAGLEGPDKVPAQIRTQRAITHSGTKILLTELTEPVQLRPGSVKRGATSYRSRRADPSPSSRT